MADQEISEIRQQTVEKRRSPRYAVPKHVECYTAIGQVFRGLLEDLSATGCRIKLQCDRVKAGQTVSVRLPGIERQVGQVRWALGERAGVQFEFPLYEPVLAHLVRPSPRSMHLSRSAARPRA